jgi:probable phosphoglycerate mutase
LTTDRELELFLVRHGETEWTERGLLHGRLDSPLSSNGVRHARQTADRLMGEKFDAIFASPKGRAMQTANILGATLNMQPIPLEGLSEMDFGWTEGKPLKLFEPDGTGLGIFRPIVWMARSLTAEQPQRFARRVQGALETMQSQHPGGRLLVVTHWGVLSMLMALIMDGNAQRWKEYGPWAACSLSVVRANGQGWQAVRLNDQAHLK